MAKKYLDDTGMSYFWGKLKAYFQEKLVSGTNIKTINNESVLGSGNISVTSTPTASTISEFDSSAHMNSTDMTSQEISDFVDSLAPSATTVVEDFTSQMTTTHTKGSIFKGLRVGKVCNITVQLTLTSAVAAWGTLATIPNGYRPYVQQKYTADGIDVTGSGSIRSLTARASGSSVEFSFCYICQ